MKTSFYQKILSRLKALKAEVLALSLAYQDKRTPFLAKFFIGLTVAYMVSPIDLIPDFIPVLGLLDDLIIVPTLIAISIRLLPAEVMVEARIKARNGGAVNQKKSWIVAAVIIAVWLVALYYCAKLITNTFSD